MLHNGFRVVAMVQVESDPRERTRLQLQREGLLGSQSPGVHCWALGGGVGSLEEEGGVAGEHLMPLSGLCLCYNKSTEGRDLHSRQPSSQARP